MKMLKSVLCVVAAGCLLVQGLSATPEPVAKEHTPFVGKWEMDVEGEHLELWIEENGQCLLVEDDRRWDATWRAEGSKVFIKSEHETITARCEEPNTLMVQEGPNGPVPFHRIHQPEPQSKYETMDRQELQETVKKLQADVLVAERIARQANNELDEAKKAYAAASDAEKPDLLIRMITVETRAKKPIGHYKQVKLDFGEATQVLRNLKPVPQKTEPATMPAVLLENSPDFIYFEAVLGVIFAFIAATPIVPHF